LRLWYAYFSSGDEEMTITYAMLSKAQKKRAKELHLDEGWSLFEAVILAFEESQ
jgi:hypothetical protein